MRSVLSFTLALLFAFAHIVQAQDQPHGVAVYEQIAPGNNIVSGSIVELSVDGLNAAKSAYSSNIIGVSTDAPAVAWSSVGQENAIPIIREGSALVLVNNSNGNISVGDYITSSDIAGVGIKADRPGTVLGRAVGNYEAENNGLLEVIVDVEFVVPEVADELDGLSVGKLVGVLSSGWQILSSGSLNVSFRYLLAVLVLLTFAAFGYLIFVRSVTTGIAALGRNPLARISIMITTGLAIALAAGAVIVGIIISIFLLAL